MLLSLSSIRILFRFSDWIEKEKGDWKSNLRLNEREQSLVFYMSWVWTEIVEVVARRLNESVRDQKIIQTSYPRESNESLWLTPTIIVLSHILLRHVIEDGIELPMNWTDWISLLSFGNLMRFPCMIFWWSKSKIHQTKQIMESKVHASKKRLCNNSQRAQTNSSSIRLGRFTVFESWEHE